MVLAVILEGKEKKYMLENPIESQKAGLGSKMSG